MKLEEIEIEEIQGYIQQEKGKGRSVKDIVKELIKVRDDVILLSHDPATADQQIIDSLKQHQK